MELALLNNRSFDIARTTKDHQTLVDYYKSNLESIRCCVAQNPFCTIDILNTLSLDISDNVRCCVANNENSSKETIKRLSEDFKDKVRLCVVKRQDLSKEILDILSKDVDDDIVILATANINFDNKDYYKDAKGFVLRKIKKFEFVSKLIKSNQLSKNLQNHYLQLITIHNISYRLSFLTNPYKTLNVGGYLIRDGSVSMERALSMNSNSPEELEALSTDYCKQVRVNVAKNRNTSVTTLDYLTSDVEDSVRKAVAENKKCSEQILIALSKDTAWTVRSAVARNPNTPADVLNSLSNDTNDIVKLYANQKLQKIAISLT